MDRLEKAGIALLVLLLVALPTAVHGWPASAAGNTFTALLLASGLTLVWWRTRPRLIARQAFTAIAESARQGREDLHRLVDLLGGTEIGGPDLTLIEEVVTRAARAGLDVSCRFEGDRDGVAVAVAHIAFRVVQESLTNALRHAPGAAVRVLVNGSGRGLTVRVENDRSVQERPNLSGTGHGLVGLRERVTELGGQLLAGRTPHGGWLVEATLPS